MDKIKVELFDSDSLDMIQYLCNITRGANKFSTVEDMRKHIIANEWAKEKVIEQTQLPHSKLRRFTDFIFLITGSSRRFLAQLTTHHVGISTMSGSLQYSDWSKQKLDDMFCVPYELLQGEEDNPAKHEYLSQCKDAMKTYDALAKVVGNDAAGYVSPQGLRNIIAVKVNLEALQYIGKQRLCKRNTTETTYIVGKMCLLIEKLFNLPTNFFMPDCFKSGCIEGKYSCKKPLCEYISLYMYLLDKFPLLENQINERESNRKRN